MECGDRHLSEYTTLVVRLGISDKSLGYLASPGREKLGACAVYAGLISKWKCV